MLHCATFFKTKLNRCKGRLFGFFKGSGAITAFETIVGHFNAKRFSQSEPLFRAAIGRGEAAGRHALAFA